MRDIRGCNILLELTGSNRSTNPFANSRRRKGRKIKHHIFLGCTYANPQIPVTVRILHFKLKMETLELM